MTETDNKTRYGRIAVILIALAIVIAAFVSFIAMNNERIYEQNTKYLQGSTEQSARRISEWMTDSQTEIKLLSSMYESTLASVDEISAAGIEQLANYTKFDYTTISLSDGLTIDDKGQEADASDREYFARGMEGESGVCAVENSLFYNDLSVIFYTPLYFKDEVVGVICGAYREDSMEKFLRTYIFNEQTNTYLLDRAGDVMAHSSITYTSGVKNAVDLYLEDESSGNISRTEQEASLESGVSVTFNYKGDSGAGTAYVMPIENYDWLIMRTFPSSITDGMQSRANAAGLMLVALVGGALALVAGFLLVQTMRQRRKLLSESAHVTSIVNSSLALFQRFAVIDLVANTYEYLKDEGIKDDLPRNGEYHMFRYYWQTRFCDDEEAERMKTELTPEHIREHLTPDTTYLHFEYRLKDPDTGEVRWLQASMLPLQRDASDQVTSVLLSVQDVTDVKEREIANHNALEDAFREAERASRAKTDFLNSMSHDIRTPMNSIMGLTAIASMYLDDPERVKDCLTKITTSSRHLLGLINEVLDMAKIESGNLGLSEEDFDLPETVESLMSIMTPPDQRQEAEPEGRDRRHPARACGGRPDAPAAGVREHHGQLGEVHARRRYREPAHQGAAEPREGLGLLRVHVLRHGLRHVRGLREDGVRAVRARQRFARHEGGGHWPWHVHRALGGEPHERHHRREEQARRGHHLHGDGVHEAARRRRPGSDAFGGPAGAGGRRRGGCRRKRLRGAEVHRHGARLRVVGRGRR